jgi:hypothetical protein
MAILRNQRTYPLSLKSAVQYALNAGVTAAYDYQGDPSNAYAGGDGAPHVGSKAYTKPIPNASLVQVTTAIAGRDPSVGRTSTASYNGPSMLDFGIGSSDGKGAFTIHRRLRTPSTVQSTSPRTVHVIRAASGSGLTLYMYGNVGGYHSFRWECGNTMVPSSDLPNNRVTPGTLCDIHLTRSGDLVTVYLNGQAVASATLPSLTTFSTAWSGLASGTNNGLNGTPADDLILIDETYWNRALSSGEVFQHQSDPYAGYANTAVVPDGVTITNPFSNAIVSNEEFAIAGYYSGATVPTGIECRFNGGAWTALSSQFIGGGAFSGTLGAVPASTGLLEVRFANATTITNYVSNITAKVPDPTVTLVSQPSPDGQLQVFTLSTTRANSVAITLVANGNGAVTQGPISIPVTSESTTASFSGIPAGDYKVTITATGPGGTATIAGNAISILGAAGGGETILDGVIPTLPTVTSVSIFPAVAVLAGGATQQFTATVAGLNSPSQAVVWSATAGSISSTGLLTLPPPAVLAQSVTVTATSTADPRWSGTALVTVLAIVQNPGTTIKLAAGEATVQQNTSSGGAVRLASKFTSERAPRSRTLYL